MGVVTSQLVSLPLKPIYDLIAALRCSDLRFHSPLLFFCQCFLGDEVSFVVKQTSKGLQAEGLQLISPEVRRNAAFYQELFQSYFSGYSSELQSP